MEPKIPTLFLVDDSRDDRLFFEEALKAAQVKAVFKAVGTGEEAVAYLAGDDRYGDRLQWPLPDVIFLDIKLPVMSGFDVLETLRGAGKTTFPVVFMMSASLDPRDVHRAYQLAANAYLVKPNSFDGLVEMIKSIDLFLLRHGLFPRR